MSWKGSERRPAPRVELKAEVKVRFEDFQDFDADKLRYSVGLAGLWLSPMGPLSISLGYPINDEADDEVQNFQFTIGTFF